MLFGSIQTVKKSVKNTSKTSASKPRNITSKVSSKVKTELDGTTKRRLEEMYQTSVGSGGESNQKDDCQFEDKMLPSDGDTKQVKIRFLDEVGSTEQNVMSAADLTDAETDPLLWNSRREPDIPKLKAVPTLAKKPKTRPVIIKVADSSETCTVKLDESGTSSTGLESRLGKESVNEAFSPPSEINFVLQCPLTPSAMSNFDEAQNFRSLIERFSLRLTPTVNTVLTKTRTEISNFFLLRWRENMIKTLGEDGFKKHQEATIWQGTTFHACIQQYLSGTPAKEIDIKENIEGYWSSLAKVLPDISDIKAVETPVSHPLLFYRGTFDCIAAYKNVLYVIDWKTSNKPKPLINNLFDNPIQVAAYLGAINASTEITSKLGAVDHAAIVVAYENGEAAHVHRMSPALCSYYWNQWCQRLHQYWTQVAAEKAK
ncbi:hypothetical protein C0Q70_13713 [Pomacea canaliculata]|uniref:Mitochondrial genome maintenance exonuclease 1 n=2 Tax=Pomacea canaliculata TaxID=400727 RepID=A0A2T7NXZ7_POMCA|nr:hypothetical protein C0Q70_13713 [Pomacea canaliculata]